MKIKYRKFLWIMMFVIIISFATLCIINNKSNTNKFSRAKLVYMQENTTKQRL